jgi:hypothetical protein
MARLTSVGMPHTAVPSKIQRGGVYRTHDFVSDSGIHTTPTPPRALDKTWYWAQATAGGNRSSSSLRSPGRNCSRCWRRNVWKTTSVARAVPWRETSASSSPVR